MNSRFGLLASLLLVGACSSGSSDDGVSGGQDLSGASPVATTNTLDVVKQWVGHQAFEKLAGGKSLWDQPAVQSAMRTAMGSIFGRQTPLLSGPESPVAQDKANPARFVADACANDDCGNRHMYVFIDTSWKSIQICWTESDGNGGSDDSWLAAGTETGIAKSSCQSAQPFTVVDRFGYGGGVPTGNPGGSLQAVKSWAPANGESHVPFDKLVGGKNLWDQPAVIEAVRSAMSPSFLPQLSELLDGPAGPVEVDAANPNILVAGGCQDHDCDQNNFRLAFDLASNTVLGVCMHDVNEITGEQLDRWFAKGNVGDLPANTCTSNMAMSQIAAQVRK
jgi:hypothetical protein